GGGGGGFLPGSSIEACCAENTLKIVGNLPILLVAGSAWAQEGQAAFVAWRAPPALFFFLQDSCFLRRWRSKWKIDLEEERGSGCFLWE
ncbi:MAG: hypothetical protein K9N62_15675, partial [Verrucomicrobia bacterium]|nr:hypothetical protein [Verrucomicrobiota bacterium]